MRGVGFPAGITPNEANELLRKDVEIAERAVLCPPRLALDGLVVRRAGLFHLHLGCQGATAFDDATKVEPRGYDSVPADLMKRV